VPELLAGAYRGGHGHEEPRRASTDLSILPAPASVEVVVGKCVTLARSTGISRSPVNAGAPEHSYALSDRCPAPERHRERHWAPTKGLVTRLVTIRGFSLRRPHPEAGSVLTSSSRLPGSVSAGHGVVVGLPGLEPGSSSLSEMDG
jgi:hypothetical protein